MSLRGYLPYITKIEKLDRYPHMIVSIGIQTKHEKSILNHWKVRCK